MKSNYYKIGEILAIYEAILEKEEQSTNSIGLAMRYPLLYILRIDTIVRRYSSYKEYKRELAEVYSGITNIPRSISPAEAGELALGYYHKRRNLNCK